VSWFSSWRRARFRNPWSHHDHGLWDILRWKTGLRASDAKLFHDADAPAQSCEISREAWHAWPESGFHVFWLGHSSFLIVGHGKRWLIDPIFSDYCAPWPLYLPTLRRRVGRPWDSLEWPAIDGILLTHTHYDHCDLPTLKKFPAATPIIVAEGHERWLRKQGFRDVREVAWWESVQIDDWRLTATPAQHFTARTPFDRNRGHWCGWCWEVAGTKIWHAGDSGYAPIFREIGERLGPLQLSMIPIGAYAPRWVMKGMHMNPEEAVQVFQDTRSERAIAMHWGTYRLTDEPLSEPPLRVAQELAARGLPPSCFEAGSVGQCWKIDDAG
jgi:N-acyl-phosphatidylethanolamine-hydrolysing phospholipase D